MEIKGFMPRSRGNFESLLWKTDIDPKLNGKIVSLDELVKLFPSDDNFSEVTLIEDNRLYNVYGRKYKNLMSEKLAYECKHCNSIIIGMPISDEEDTIGPLCGRRGYSLECGHCHSELKFSGMVS